MGNEIPEPIAADGNEPEPENIEVEMRVQWLDQAINQMDQKIDNLIASLQTQAAPNQSSTILEDMNNQIQNLRTELTNLIKPQIVPIVTPITAAVTPTITEEEIPQPQNEDGLLEVPTKKKFLLVSRRVKQKP